MNINWPEVMAGMIIFCFIGCIVTFIFADIMIRLTKPKPKPKKPKAVQPIQAPSMFNPYPPQAPNNFWQGQLPMQPLQYPQQGPVQGPGQGPINVLPYDPYGPNR